jgi:hypothetical protein
MARIRVWVSLLSLCVVLTASGQQLPASAAVGVVPPVVKFSGTLTDAGGKPLTGTVGVTFSLYKESHGGGTAVSYPCHTRKSMRAVYG